ncbi:MAG TPA: BON domain-containing protein [Minicystis sp.]|nr:BON domain-containing protein [Minicystis sp.]
MHKAILWTMTAALLVGGAACEKASGEQRGNDQRTTTTPAAPADTMKLNPQQQGRTSAQAAPGDQGATDTDQRITQQVRRAIESDTSLSSEARNVTVVTHSGVVTLKGNVKSDAERKSLESKAKGIADVKQVEDQLDVAK